MEFHQQGYHLRLDGKPFCHRGLIGCPVQEACRLSRKAAVQEREKVLGVVGGFVEVCIVEGGCPVFAAGLKHKEESQAS